MADETNEQNTILPHDPIKDPNSQIYDRFAKYKIFGRVSAILIITPYLYAVFKDFTDEKLITTGIFATIGVALIIAGIEGLTSILDFLTKIKK